MLEAPRQASIYEQAAMRARRSAHDTSRISRYSVTARYLRRFRSDQARSRSASYSPYISVTKRRNCAGLRRFLGANIHRSPLALDESRALSPIPPQGRTDSPNVSVKLVNKTKPKHRPGIHRCRLTICLNSASICLVDAELNAFTHRRGQRKMNCTLNLAK